VQLLSERLLDLSALATAEVENESEEDISQPHSRPEIPDWVFCSALIIGFSLLAYMTVYSAMFRPLWMAAAGHRWGVLIMRPSILVLALGTGLLGFRTVLWLRYRPFLSCSYAAAPSLTVVIPAYNEGAMVMQSVESVLKASYPAGRLEIIVVDDGSTDDTWSYIRRVASRYPRRITALRLAKNQGKRAALELGFRRARGEIIVTIDSDSVIGRDALLAITGPFRDAIVGAVSGNVRVYNREEGIIPRMLHVQYILSFDLIRAVESAYGNVYCCPGALTAYRASLVREVLDDWMSQTFLGSPCTYGEDRALTNLILAAGYDTVYQRSAEVQTMAPKNYNQLCRMFLRWDRSYIREEVHFLRIVWKRPWRARLIALCDRLITNLRHPVNYASLILLASLVASKPLIIFRVLAAIGLVSLFNMIYYLRTERSRDFLYGVCYSYFAFFGLFWILPYSACTLRCRSWLTR
jgi:hyaluronan synthase